MATVGNVQEEAGEDKVVALGEISKSDIRGRYPTGKANMGNNVPHLEREGVVPGYWTG